MKEVLHLYSCWEEHHPRYLHLPSWTDPATVLCSNHYTWCRWLLHMLKPTKPTAVQFIKKPSKFTLVPLEWWRPCLHADLQASSSLHTVCDIAEKTKHLSEFIWSSIVMIKNTGDKSGLITDNLIIHNLITLKWHIDSSKNTQCHIYQKPHWKPIKIHGIKDNSSASKT